MGVFENPRIHDDDYQYWNVIHTYLYWLFEKKFYLIHIKTQRNGKYEGAFLPSLMTCRSCKTFEKY